MREDCGCARTVSDYVTGLFSGLAQHLRTEILLGVLELHFLGDRHAVVADDRCFPLLLNQHRL